MCQPKPGIRCPHEAALDAHPARQAYSLAHPDGPSLDPLSAASPVLTLVGDKARIPTPRHHTMSPDNETPAWASILSRSGEDDRTQQTVGREIVANVTTWTGKPVEDDDRAFLASASNAEFTAALQATQDALQASPACGDSAAADMYLRELMKARIAGEYAAQLGHANRDGAHEWQHVGGDQHYCMNCHVTAERTGDPRFVWPCEQS